MAQIVALSFIRSQMNILSFHPETYMFHGIIDENGIMQVEV